VTLFALGCGQTPFRTVEEILDSNPIPWELYQGISVSENFKALVTQMLSANLAIRATLPDILSN